MCSANPAERVSMEYVIQSLKYMIHDAAFFARTVESDSGSSCNPSSNVKVSVSSRLDKLNELGVLGKANGDDNSESEPLVVECISEYVLSNYNTPIESIFDGAQDQLNDIESDTSPMDRHVYERLECLHSYLDSLQKCPRELLKAVIDLAKDFTDSLSDRVMARSLASRTIASRGIGQHNLAFHHRIDDLLVRFDLQERNDEVHSWKQRWDLELETAQNNFATIVNDPDFFNFCRDVDERIEIATLFAFELKRRRANYSTDVLQTMTRALDSLRLAIGWDTKEIINVPRWFVPWNEVKLDDYIGEGSFGFVHRAKWFEADVAVKKLFQADKQQFLSEADVWFSLNHPNVIKLFGACHVGTPFYLCEYAENGTLRSFARKQGWQDLSPSYSESHVTPVWAALYNAAKGLHHLHQRGIVHGDLKGNNILITADHKAKLSDFGLSLFAHEVPSKGDKQVGAIRWMAPERLTKHDNGPSFESDIFSFGMCIIEIVSGLDPWSSIGVDNAVKAHVLQGELPQRPIQFADDEWTLQRMCCFEPSKRIDSFSLVMILRSYMGSDE